MKATKKQIEKGRELAVNMKTEILFINAAGEYFTSENLARLSVAGDKNKYQALNYSTETDADEQEELAEISGLKTVEEVQAILDLELDGGKREDVIKACEARIEELQK